MQEKEYRKMFELEEEHFWFVGKRLFIKSVLSPYKKRIGRILDVGAGTGGTTLFLRNFGKVVGVEKNPLAITLAKERGLSPVKAHAERLPFDNNSFDLVSLFDVLYNQEVKSEKKALKEAYRVLRPGGLLLITDSAFEFLRSSHDSALGGKRRYTINSMGKLLKNEKFKIVKASYIFFSIFPLVLLRRLFFKGLGSDVRRLPWLINQTLLLIVALEAFILRHVDFPWGSSLIVLAKKA